MQDLFIICSILDLPQHTSPPPAPGSRGTRASKELSFAFLFVANSSSAMVPAMVENPQEKA